MSDNVSTDFFETPAKAEKAPRQPRKITPLIRRVLTCVPTQLHQEKDKLEWLEKTIEAHQPNIFITPQEFFGGVAMMPQHPFYREDEILPQLSKITDRYKIGLITGVVENDGKENRETLWVVDNGQLIGKVRKFALPRYSRKGSKGSYQAVEEMSLQKRFVKFPIQGVEVSLVFCWESFSTALWNGLRQVEPDFVAHCVKFGVNSYPQYEVKEDGLTYAKVGKFNYMQFKKIRDDPWFDRLRCAANYDVLCPIFTSCNSWDCRGRSHAFCGPLWDTDNLTDIWCSDNTDKVIPEHVTVTEYDFNRVRGMRGGKWKFYELVDQNPPGRFLELTMLNKIKNIEKKRLRHDTTVGLEAFDG